jgi:hypothetical protein
MQDEKANSNLRCSQVEAAGSRVQEGGDGLGGHGARRW